MPISSNPMEIFKLLDKSNCKECGEPTCMAFAAAVFKGRKQLSACTHLHAFEPFAEETEKRPTFEESLEAVVEELKNQIAGIDLSSVALKLDANFSNGLLTMKILGKNFSVDSKGNLFSDIHIHPWVTIPILSYIIQSKGTDVSNKWVSFRDLKNGQTWHGLFGQRCEKPLKQVADKYTDIFEDMMSIFNGIQVENHYKSDVSLILKPLPKVPILICYWKAEDELESSLNIFFDSTVEDHLSIDSIYGLGTGLVAMFEKIALRHSFQ